MFIVVSFVSAITISHIKRKDRGERRMGEGGGEEEEPSLRMREMLALKQCSF